MNKRAIAVIGQGFVGGSLSIGMCHAYDVYAYDKAGKAVDPQGRGNIYNGSLRRASDLRLKLSLPEFVKNLENGELIGESRARYRDFTGIYFVGVPTPMRKNGSADTRIVESVLRELAEVPGERIAVVKSTCPPGSTERWNEMFNAQGLHVIFNPEFLREVSAVEDFINQDRIVLGGPRPWINDVKNIYNVAFPNVPVIKTSATNAEMIKYVTNTFLASKVSFANEIYDVCQGLGKHGLDVDYDRVIEIATLDKRLGTSHWKVPGPMPADDGSGQLLRGYAGSCFVKDINALLFLAKSLNIDVTMLQAAWDKNLKVRPEKDWENLIGRAISDNTDEETKE